jgi:Flp pilus assembly pilin Flp
MKNQQMSKNAQFKNKLGQNTAEYMLLLLLIGGGSVMAFKVFGAGIINRFSSVTSIITGGTEVKVDASKIKAKSDEVDFKSFDGEASTTP